MQILYLIRHGETEFNREGRIQGFTDSALSDLGREQARRLGKRLELEDFGAAYTSPLSRAEETCRLALNGSMDFAASDGLREINLGVWEGELASDLRESDPERVRQWFLEPSALRVDGAETLDRFRGRVVDTIDGIRGDHPDGTIAAFVHGGVICAYLTHILRMDLDDIWRFRIRNASITRVAYPQGRPRMDLLGDISHLDGAASEPPATSRIVP